jgi:hypothetical protein
MHLRTCETGSSATSPELLQHATHAATRVPVINFESSASEALPNVDRPQAGGPPAAGFARSYEQQISNVGG